MIRPPPPATTTSFSLDGPPQTNNTIGSQPTPHLHYLKCSEPQISGDASYDLSESADSTIHVDTSAQASPPSTGEVLQPVSIELEDPFAVISNNKAGFKYKYPEAAPTPDGEDDIVWNNVYSAANTRMYRKHHNARKSRKCRESGETRTLAIEILKERHATALAAAKASGVRSTPKASTGKQGILSGRPKMNSLAPEKGTSVPPPKVSVKKGTARTVKKPRIFESENIIYQCESVSCSRKFSKVRATQP